MLLIKITTKELTLSSFFVVLMALSAIISFQFSLLTSIPFSLQIFMVLIVGCFLGARLGVLVIICYIILGIIGLPVFSAMSSGIGTILGPTGGFILGFIPTVYVVGILTKKFDLCAKNKTFGLFICLFIGLFITYFFGTVQFMFLTNVSLEKAIFVTIVPFILFDIIKVILCVTIVKRCVR